MPGGPLGMVSGAEWRGTVEKRRRRRTRRRRSRRSRDVTVWRWAQEEEEEAAAREGRVGQWESGPQPLPPPEEAVALSTVAGCR